MSSLQSLVIYFVENSIMNIIESKVFDEERALYNLKDTEVRKCIFAGEADGESVLKEARNIVLADSSFSLRYPLWHVRGFKLIGCDLDEGTRAPIWYSCNGEVENCVIKGV